jgi:hypothetical protein
MPAIEAGAVGLESQAGDALPSVLRRRCPRTHSLWLGRKGSIQPSVSWMDQSEGLDEPHPCLGRQERPRCFEIGVVFGSDVLGLKEQRNFGRHIRDSTGGLPPHHGPRQSQSRISPALPQSSLVRLPEHVYHEATIGDGPQPGLWVVARAATAAPGRPTRRTQPHQRSYVRILGVLIRGRPDADIDG